ncbi:HAD-IIIA family hydrolase [Burkholderia sp. COPS]|uniref:D-glycero-alpha-D-manno-heptose-1,7-bisphosphate 7-phosphatase n=1 Tax=Burkholderia sp. COPS TaxID=2597663 RepID=UPI001CA49E2B|nr:HAD-IIIA family hydrolase [Burkholderia sp. COPS]MBW5809650.1 HAD-IIIA family hydrolase [Burkholderia sp. COPS]
MALRHERRLPGAVLLDKDGTLLDDVPYNVDPARMRLAPGAARALRILGATGMPLAVVSNQPGVALGRFGENELGAVRQRLAELFEANGATLTDFFYCPHHPQGSVAHYACDCLCRKPRPGMLRRALAALGAVPEWSWMIGDILDDVEAGRTARCGTILVDRGHETEWRVNAARTPHHVVDRLDLAADIVAREAVRRHGTWVRR